MCTGGTVAMFVSPVGLFGSWRRDKGWLPLIKRLFFKMSKKLVWRCSVSPERAETNYPEQVEKDLDDNYAAAIISDVWTAGILLAQQHVKTSLITFRMFAHQHSTHSGH